MAETTLLVRLHWYGVGEDDDPRWKEVYRAAYTFQIERHPEIYLNLAQPLQPNTERL